MSFRDPLPEGCPPDSSEEITTPRVVFRLARNNPPTADDFRSQRQEQPDHDFGTLSECIVRGVSVFTDLKDAQKVGKLPRQRNKHICRVTLAAGAGRIQQTFRLSHHTWWPFAEFAILEHCAKEAS